MTTMSIAATRMYRSLADFASESTEMSDIHPPLFPLLFAHCDLVPFSLQDGPQTSDPTIPRSKSAAHVSIPLTRMEVAMHTV